MSKHILFKFITSLLLFLFISQLFAGADFINSREYDAVTGQNKKQQEFLKFGKIHGIDNPNIKIQNDAFLNDIVNFFQSKMHPAEKKMLLYNDLKEKYSLQKTAASPYVKTEEISEFWFFGDYSKEKTNFSYDGMGNNILINYEVWDDPNWISNARTTFSINEDGNMLEILDESWKDSQWVNFSKTVFTYNTDNRILEQQFYNWNGSWVKGNAVFFTYDVNGNLIEELNKSWDGSKFNNYFRVTSAFNDMNLLTSVIFAFADGNFFNDAWKDSYTYDETGFLTEHLFEFMEGNTWVNSMKEIQVPDENGNMVEFLSQYWENSNWINDYRADLTYNEFNNQTGATGYNWNGSDWYHTVIIEFVYDEFQNNTLYELKRDFGQGLSPMNRIERTFVSIATNIDEKDLKPAQFELKQNYPNPFNPSTTIEFSLSNQSAVSLKVFDLTGREVAELINGSMTQGVHTIQFNAGLLVSGVYFYRLETEGFVKTKKLTLLK
ncbi:MAG: T9SS type A sorting domain-containing protein [Calditrichaeota bacterium]|nr:T9SS type A sorting domain-containing protein [Calditrichota bacterium]